MATLENLIQELGLTLTPSWTGTVQRKGAEWFVGKEFNINGKLVKLAWLGNFSKDVRGEWRDEAATELKGKDKESLQKAIDEILETERAAREEHWKLVAKEAEEEWWKQATDRGSPESHPYLQKKKLSSLHGARIFVNPEGHPVLLVPMRDGSGVIWNVTRIYSKTFETKDGVIRGNKFILAGGRKQGLFHLLGEIAEKSTIYVVEGFATGASVFEALGNQPVAICFDAGNLLPVAKDLRSRYPLAKLVFCADNDLWTRKPNGLPWNPGKEKALEAASHTQGSVVLPRFLEAQLQNKPTDFNDLHALCGVGEVREQLTNPGKLVQEVVPLVKEGKGVKARVSEKHINSALLEYFQGNILAYDRDLFRYGSGHWQLLSIQEHNKIRQLIASLAPDYGSRDIEGAYKYFLIHCPTTPKDINLFQPNPFAANFQNGTLHMVREGRKYRTEFHPHRKDDYITYILPFDYRAPGAGVGTGAFAKMLTDVWAGDPDLADKIRLYKQILGACLVPAFPAIVMFIGPPGSGKSTLIKIARHLVSDGNWCTVDPCDFKGFLMEDMIGKLVNLHTDIDLQTPWRDNVVKRIIDRLPIAVNRKFQRAISTFLPSVHLFGGNGMPKTLDGASRAYERRLTVLKTASFKAEGNYDKEFDQHIWESDGHAVIEAAVEGLLDLLANDGHYLKLESGKALVRKMQDASDPVQIFLDEVRGGHVSDKQSTVNIDADGKIARPQLWAIFCAWRDGEDRQTKEMGRNHFFDKLEDKGHQCTQSRGVRYIHGISCGASEEGKF